MLRTQTFRRTAYATASPPPAGPDATDWEDKKKRRNRLVQLPKRRDQVLAEIEAAERRKQEITDLYCSPGFFERTGKDEVEALEIEKTGLDPRIEALMAEWESLEKEIAELQSETEAC